MRISGTYEHAISVILGVSEKDARRKVMEYTRLATGSPQVYTSLGTRKSVSADDAVVKDEKRLNSAAFTYLPLEVREWLDGRGIDQESRGRWQIGYDEDEERIVIPAYDENDRFRFLIKRSIKHSGHMKYLYTEGAIKTSLLFGACFLESQGVRSDGLILCEGSLDTIRLHQMGATNAVAILGTGISRRQVRIVDKLGPKRVYLLFDKDAAGVHNILAAQKAITKIPLWVCRYPRDKSDPAEMGKGEIERSIERALPMHKFLALTKEARNEKAHHSARTAYSRV